ncbi:porin family protein [Shewanella alkalitolerans]|uniref:porin family protein n=1 Tax=Shewanella alkalitolerans TaxID=2864209 RepID=UPI001C65AB0A|nr:porin family protein [Shewanella alkalitolerans]QYJ97598.1 porin family protein [Shewanella alkalitolerans]
MLKPLLGAVLLVGASPLLAADQTQGPSPKTAITLDYIPAESALYGITLAPSHYDRNYANWGYYLGYAQSQKRDIEVEAPSEAYSQDKLWRFGLSYGLTDSLSLYGGASAYTQEYSYTNNISPRIVDGKPTWETERETRWGGELGVRYRLGRHLVLGLGYDSGSQSAIFSLGYSN